MTSEQDTSTVPDPTDEGCPYCGATDGTRQTSDTGRTQAWSCDRCGTNWAFSLVNHAQQPAYFEQLCAAVEQIGRLRWTLRQIVALASDADGLTDRELRDRLLTLAQACAR